MIKSDASVQVQEEDLAPLLTVRLSRNDLSPHLAPFHIMKHWTRKIRIVIALCLLTSIIGIIYVSHVCSTVSCAPAIKFNIAHPPRQDKRGSPVLDNAARPLTDQDGVTYDMLFEEGSYFDIAGKDVLVFLHIQKTGGTIFGRHLVRDLDLDKPCVCHRKRKRCDCFRPFSKTRQWLFSRYSTGWKCGLHADWTELTPCVDQALDLYEGTPMKRRYFYITILRDPVHRYLSEFRHVQRGATWKHSRHFCGGKESVFNIPKCYKGDNWTDVELDDFMNCPHNLANNRQTRMLADLNLVGCYNSSLMDPEVRDQIMLTSAKTNLARMAFFGLTEQQQVTQYVFEETFRLNFLVPFEQYNATLAYLTLSELNPKQLKRVKELNRLDIELYQFAVDLLNQRFERLKSRDGDFPHHWNRIITKSNETVDVDFEQESS